MTSAQCAAPLGLHQRSRGELHLGFKRRNAETALGVLRQVGCLKARLPRPEPGGWRSAVMLNSSGGVAGGDDLATTVVAGPGTRATVSSQAAERFYRALPGSTATVRNRIEVLDGAALEWLPQETILFDRCAMRRRLTVDLAPNAAFLGVESLVFGRAAMDEVVRQAQIDDLIEIRRAGVLLLHDRVRLAGPVDAILSRKAIGAGAKAMATLIQVSSAAVASLDALREVLAPYDAGASACDGMLIARVVARDSACLRRAVVAALNVLREGRPLPRVWSC